MIWSELPSLNSLRALAAVAETGSYSQAGAALNVSHAAVGQQVRALEAWLGVALVVRQGRGISLTPEGEALARDLSTGFAAIHHGVEAVVAADTRRPVRITMSPAFAASWLLPRITEFRQLHPEVELMLNATAALEDPEPGGVDVAIRFCNGASPGLQIEPLLIPALVVVAAPQLIGTRQPGDMTLFTELPWLQELGTNEVTDWLARRGLEASTPLKIIHMPGNLIMEAVRRGDGLTYTPRPFVEADIGSGKLLELFSESDVGGFHIVTRPGVLRPPARAFVRWLKRKASQARTDPHDTPRLYRP
jgi:LysR family glycine cleavage system transcriptional activator